MTVFVIALCFRFEIFAPGNWLWWSKAGGRRRPEVPELTGNRGVFQELGALRGLYEARKALRNIDRYW